VEKDFKTHNLTMPLQHGSMQLYRIGEEGSGTKLRFGGEGFQDFEEIQAQCKESGKLFEDPEFPLGDEQLSRPGDLLWKRPHEIQKEYYKDGKKVVFSCQEEGDDSAICRFDVHQGGIGNCGSVASFASSALHPDVRSLVIPDDNTFEDGQYTGAFHFRYYRQGRWLDVVIDDRIPCNNESKPHSLAPVRSGNASEFWPCLLEKVRAKLGNSFEGTKTGGGSSGLEGVSGGCMEGVDSTSPGSFQKLLKMWEGGAVGEIGSQVGNEGWVKGHGYSVTGFAQVNTTDGETVELMRIRNPWGHHEFTGEWSDSSPEWDRVSQEDKDRLCLTVRDDGEFWFEYKRFKELAGTNDVLICLLNPKELDEYKEFDWNYTKFFGDWTEDHIDGYFGPKCQHKFKVDKEEGADVMFSLSTLAENYGLPTEDITCGLLFYKLKEKDLGQDSFPPKHFASQSFVNYTNGKLGTQLSLTSNKLEPGTYCVTVYTKKLPTDSRKGYALRVLWEK